MARGTALTEGRKTQWRQRLQEAGWGDYLDALAPVIEAFGFVIAQVFWLLAPFDGEGKLARWARSLEEQRGTDGG